MDGETLRHLLHLVKLQEKMMSVLDDLNTAVTALANNFSSLDAAIQREVAALVAAQKANDPATIANVTQKISAISAQMSTDAQTLADSVTPAPAPAPAAAPAAPAATTSAPAAA